MLVYTFDSDIKNKFLKFNQLLIKEKELNGRIIYLFRVSDLSLINNNFSYEENKKIFIYDNKMTF